MFCTLIKCFRDNFGNKEHIGYIKFCKYRHFVVLHMSHEIASSSLRGSVRANGTAFVANERRIEKLPSCRLN